MVARAGGPCQHQPTEVGQAKMAGCHVSRVYGSGLPMPRRRTFATSTNPLRRIGARWPSLTRWRRRSGILPALAANAGSRGTGSPSRMLRNPIQAPGGSRGTPAVTITPRTMRMRPDINLHGKRYPLRSRSPPASAGGFLRCWARDHANSAFTGFAGSTPVSLESRPWYSTVNFAWSMPRRWSIVACRSRTCTTSEMAL